MPVGMLLDGMDPGELAEWQAYFCARELADKAKEVRTVNVQETSGEDALNFMTAKLGHQVKR